MVTGEDVSYPRDGDTLRAYAAWSADNPTMPGLVLIPDVRGLGEHYRDVARRFATEGFFVLAVDLYSREGAPDLPDMERAGWHVRKPKATMFVWAEIPDEYKPMGSLEFCKFLLHEAKVAVSPGIGFGEYGDQFVRFALIENEHRTRQAIRGIKKALGATLGQATQRAQAG